eukprot:6212152-Pleurochrysis_carterae.AAC.1
MYKPCAQLGASGGGWQRQSARGVNGLTGAAAADLALSRASRASHAGASTASTAASSAALTAAIKFEGGVSVAPCTVGPLVAGVIDPAAAADGAGDDAAAAAAAAPCNGAAAADGASAAAGGASAAAWDGLPLAALAAAIATALETADEVTSFIRLTSSLAFLISTLSSSVISSSFLKLSGIVSPTPAMEGSFQRKSQRCMYEERSIRKIAFPRMVGEMRNGPQHIYTQRMKQQAGCAGHL